MNENLEMALQWVEKAHHDMGCAKIIWQHIPDYSDTIAFHCQQAAEKSIKAILVYNGKEFKRSHDLRYLIDTLSL